MNFGAKKGGFAGLSDLTSDPSKFDSEKSLTTLSTKTQSPQVQIYDLVDTTKWPWLGSLTWEIFSNSVIYIWGDFLVIFKYDSHMHTDYAGLEDGTGFYSDSYIFHVYVFYRHDKNPHTQFLVPILVASIGEDVHQVATGEKLSCIIFGNDKIDWKNVTDRELPSCSIFRSRSTGKITSGESTIDDAKTFLLSAVGEKLNLCDKPTLLGTFEQSHGRPETGLPAFTKSKNSSSPKSMHVLTIAAIIVIFFAFIASFILGLSIWASDNTYDNSRGIRQSPGTSAPFSSMRNSAQKSGSQSSAPLAREVQTQSNANYSKVPSSSVSNPPRSAVANSEVQYSKPPEGTDRVLSVSQICWCIKEDIRLEAMRPHITYRSVDDFNLLVDDYNRRCALYRYHGNDLITAKRLVEVQRISIEFAAVADGVKLGRSPQYPSQGVIEEVQTLLLELGYNPGPVDGILGRMTASAIRVFQGDIGIEEDGEIDDMLLVLLRNIPESIRDR